MFEGRRLGGFLKISDLARATVTGGEVVDSLVGGAGVFIFADAPELESLFSWSDNSLDVLGVPPAALAHAGNLFLRHVHPDDRFTVQRAFDEAVRSGTPLRRSYRWIRPDVGEVRLLHISASLRRGVEGAMFEGAVFDITGAGSAVHAAAAAERELLAAVPGAAVLVDGELFVRSAAGDRELLEPVLALGSEPLEALAGRRFPDLVSDAERAGRYASALTEIVEGARVSFEERVTGLARVTELRFAPVIGAAGEVNAVLIAAGDGSLLVELETRVAKLERAASFALLASGLAHNFNNSLQAILGLASPLTKRPRRQTLVAENAGEIVELAHRSSELTRQLVTLGERVSALFTAVDLNVAILTAVNRIEDILSTEFQVTVALTTLPPVSARFHELVDSLEVLLRYSRELFPQCKALHLESSACEVADDDVPDVKPGRHARLVVYAAGSPGHAGRGCDVASGALLAPARTRFPRRAQRELNSALSVIAQLGGTVVFEKRALFSVYLPACADEAARTSEAARGDGAEILIVEDEPVVALTVTQVLQEAGFRCAVARDRGEALRYLKRNREQVRLVLLDCMLPGEGGGSLLREMRKMKRSLRCIGFSGAPARHADELRSAGARKVLGKPVEPGVLVGEVRAALGRRRGSRNRPE